jgi:hypothetical protein
MNRVVMLIAIILILPGVRTGAQWLQHPTTGIPRTADGTPDLSAPALRTAEGKPDLSGIWGPEFIQGFPKYLLNIAVDLEPDGVPFQDWARTVYRERMEWNSKDDPLARCKPTGIPRLIGFPAPFKIVQRPELIVILYEQDTTYRQIFMDGRALPTEVSQPSWMGYSVGRWEGDVLVIDSFGFNATSWLDVQGHPHTEAMRVIERYRRVNMGQLEIQITIDDPNAYTRPWTVTQHPRLLADTELLELFCTENEKSLPHVVGK